MRRYLFLILFAFHFDAFSEEELTPEERNAACDAAITAARTNVQNQLNTLNNTIANNPHAVDAASDQPLTTGNPVTDAMAAVSKAQNDLAQAQQQKTQAQSQVDNECFQQFEDISDKAHDIRQKDYDRLRQINMAEGEKMKQESEIRLACWKESSGLYQGEIARLATYANRTVGSLSGATRSKKDIEGLRTNFYNQCCNSPATQEALRSCKSDLDIKMRNFSSMATEFASDLEYHENTKMTRMNEHCKLRQEQIDAQFAPMRNAAMQSMAMGVLAVTMASQTAAASTEGQQQVRDTYNSLADILNPTKWDRIVQKCTNLHTEQSANPSVDSVPADAYSLMRPIHAACRPPGMSDSINCFKSSGTSSSEQQRASRATASGQ